MENNRARIYELKPSVLRAQLKRAQRDKEIRRKRRNFLRAQTGMVSRQPRG